MQPEGHQAASSPKPHAIDSRCHFLSPLSLKPKESCVGPTLSRLQTQKEREKKKKNLSRGPLVVATRAPGMQVRLSRFSLYSYTTFTVVNYRVHLQTTCQEDVDGATRAPNFICMQASTDLPPTTLKKKQASPHANLPLRVYKGTQRASPEGSLFMQNAMHKMVLKPQQIVTQGHSTT